MTGASSGAVAARLPDGRLHLQHGPIDLVIEGFGRPGEIERAYQAASWRFATVLPELCAELDLLRRPARSDGAERPSGVVARRMAHAVEPFAAETFITPMAAVAGSVAEEVLSAMLAAGCLDRAVVNNGGDIALFLSPGTSLRLGLVDRPDRPRMFGTADIRAADGIGGIATSGWRGRSFSLGIADAVSVLAGSASAADAAATIIANAVDLPGHPSVARQPACERQPDSDLGARLVTVGVGPLEDREIDRALERGLAVAEVLVRRRLIVAAALHLRGTTLATAFEGFLPALPDTKGKEPSCRPSR